MKKQPTPIAIAVVQCDDRVLIGQRPDNVPLGGLWEFPGGKVKSGESCEDAARRECLEETGLEVEVAGELSVSVHTYEHDRVQLYFFACQPCDSERQPLAPFRWISRDELDRYEFPVANREIVELLKVK